MWADDARNRSLRGVNEDFEHRQTANDGGAVDIEQVLKYPDGYSANGIPMMLYEREVLDGLDVVIGYADSINADISAKMARWLDLSSLVIQGKI